MIADTPKVELEDPYTNPILTKRSLGSEKWYASAALLRTISRLSKHKQRLLSFTLDHIQYNLHLPYYLN